MVIRINSYAEKGATVNDLGASSDPTKNMFSIDYRQIDKPTIMLTACIHGSEWESTYWTLQFLDYIIDPEIAPLDTQKYFNLLKENYGFFVLPVINPSGFEHSRRAGVDSVDYNREFENDSYAEVRSVKESISAVKPLVNIDNHTSGLAYDAVGYGGYGNDIRVMMENVIKNSNFVMSLERINWYPSSVQTDKAIGRGYISDQDSIRDTKILSILLEGIAAYDRTESVIQEKLDFGLNAILITCLYADRYLKSKIQK